MSILTDIFRQIGKINVSALKLILKTSYVKESPKTMADEYFITTKNLSISLALCPDAHSGYSNSELLFN